MPDFSPGDHEYEDHQWDDEDWSDDDCDDQSDDEEEPTVPCPYCGEAIHEDAQWCPRCERYISEEDRPAMRKPWWVLVGVAAVMYTIYRWLAPW